MNPTQPTQKPQTVEDQLRIQTAEVSRLNTEIRIANQALSKANGARAEADLAVSRLEVLEFDQRSRADGLQALLNEKNKQLEKMKSDLDAAKAEAAALKKEIETLKVATPEAQPETAQA